MQEAINNALRHSACSALDIHRAQVMQRLDIHDVAGLTRFAVRVGLVGTD